MKGEAKVVIIGGGVAGCSLLYHLAKLGLSDAVLIEKNELTSGSTCHAAGLCTQFNPSFNMMKLLQYSLELYQTLEAETGQAVDFRRSGSVRLASSEERLDEFWHRKGIADTLGVPFEIVSPERASELFPRRNRAPHGGYGHRAHGWILAGPDVEGRHPSGHRRQRRRPVGSFYRPTGRNRSPHRSTRAPFSRHGRHRCGS